VHGSYTRKEGDMKLHPFHEVAENAEYQIGKGAKVYQQWQCAHCGMKQTMPDQNKFYTHGKCEECSKITDIEKNGCNFMVAMTTDDKEFEQWIRKFMRA
jgi:hypothetical protein